MFMSIGHVAKLSNYINCTYCTYRDRMARFGTELLKHLCSIYNVQSVKPQIKEISERDKFAHGCTFNY